MATVVVNISLDNQADKDILAWLDQQPNRSHAVREAIRSHIAKTEGPTLADIVAEIRSLPARLRVVAVGDTSLPEATGDEPEAAAANLDGLIERIEGGEF